MKSSLGTLSMAFLIRSELRYPPLISDLTFFSLSFLSFSLLFVGSLGGSTIQPCIVDSAFRSP